MININGKMFNLCLFDTNALSSFLQNTDNWITFYKDEFSLDDTIICYSVFTLSELYYRKELFEKYLDFFSIFPSAVLDGHESIFQKEVDNYQLDKEINPIVMIPSILKEEGLTAKEALLKVIKDSGFVTKTEYWRQGQKEVLDGITTLKKNYPPKKEKYSRKEIDEFNFIVTTSQIGIRNRSFAEEILSSGQYINLDEFNSIKCTSYFVFYKFYPDNRKPIKSDVFDIIISSLLPYVDFFITEGNMHEIIKQIQKNHDFLKNIKPYKLKEINKIIG